MLPTSDSVGYSLAACSEVPNTNNLYNINSLVSQSRHLCQGNVAICPGVKVLSPDIYLFALLHAKCFAKKTSRFYREESFVFSFFLLFFCVQCVFYNLLDLGTHIFISGLSTMTMCRYFFSLLIEASKRPSNWNKRPIIPVLSPGGVNKYSSPDMAYFPYIIIYTMTKNG